MGERGYREDSWEDRYWGVLFPLLGGAGGQIPGSSCGLLVGGEGDLGVWKLGSFYPGVAMVGGVGNLAGGWGVGGCVGGFLRAKRPLELVSLGWSEEEGHLRKAVVTEGGSWFLANKPWIPSPPSPKHASCLFSFYTVVGSREGPVEMKLFEEDGLSCYPLGE